jgi:hypothetical protein
MSVVVFPVPGAPSTAAQASCGSASTADWDASSLLMPQTLSACADSERERPAVPFCRNLGAVDIRIGIINTSREINFESSQTGNDVEKTVQDALESGAKFMKLVDNKGRIFIVPMATFAYIEVGSEESRRIGFVA